MAEIVRLFPRQRHFRGYARQALTETLNETAKPIATVVITLGKNGHYAMRSAHKDGEIHSFDMYARASAILRREADSYMAQD